ncbi:MAG: hypothetical protein WC679_00295 [Bacteroidales bacterium]|jgi:hypothetical protein
MQRYYIRISFRGIKSKSGTYGLFKTKVYADSEALAKNKALHVFNNTMSHVEFISFSKTKLLGKTL